MVSRDALLDEWSFPCLEGRTKRRNNSSVLENSTPAVAVQLGSSQNKDKPEEAITGEPELEPGLDMGNLDQVDDYGENSQLDMTYHKLARDRPRREARPNHRHNSFVELVYTAQVAVNKVQRVEHETYSGAISNQDKENGFQPCEKRRSP